MKNPITLLFIGLIKFYRYFISPMLGQKCKYYPSCSSYGLEAIQTHGPIKGLGLCIWRILRCNPFSDGGYDPVPSSNKTKTAHSCAHHEPKTNGDKNNEHQH